MSTKNLSITFTQQNQEGFVSHIVSAIRGHFSALSAENQLERLTDHELEDIGITRSQIPYVVRNSIDSYR